MRKASGEKSVGVFAHGVGNTGKAARERGYIAYSSDRSGESASNEKHRSGSKLSS